ncbi:dTDP-glucose 4,6-dehydratase [Paludifilum halophilum]|uniref:dTDP-glucose 4,6-dehydratase n=1 Tax=Paludifilum halophilum TaxID=1642702 RepID=A0A235BB82_9BACL|nr:dTDP-glucose 4,6-dehydratase [Paludifilum halophilum]OYD09564.1 dTDP-glucose 4,6-dehydratase [Paludifilum halophilum]
MSRTILVTGGTGFIGSHYIRYLLKRYPAVQVLNADALTYSANRINLKEVEGDSRYSFIRVDLSDPTEVKHLFERKIDEVVHFAAESHVDRSIQGADVFIHSNIIGTYHLLEEVRRSQTVERMVHISTDEVYGSIPRGRTREGEALVPGNPYSASKGSSDLFCLAYANTYGLPLMISRCTNNYGPNQHPEKFIPRMILHALQDRLLPIYGNGLQERDWIHVEDHCAAVDRIRKRGEPGEIYHIGMEQTVSNREIARRILTLLNKPGDRIRYVSDRPGHDLRYSLDTTKIREQLSWSPQISLEKGLQQTVEWYARVDDEWLQSFGAVDPKEGEGNRE